MCFFWGGVSIDYTWITSIYIQCSTRPSHTQLCTVFPYHPALKIWLKMTSCIALKKLQHKKIVPIRSRAIVEHVAPRRCTRMNHDDQWWPYYRLNKQKIRALQLRRVFLDGSCLAWRPIHALQSSRKHHYWLPKALHLPWKDEIVAVLLPLWKQNWSSKATKSATLALCHSNLQSLAFAVSTLTYHDNMLQSGLSVYHECGQHWHVALVLPENSRSKSGTCISPTLAWSGQETYRKATKSFHNKQEFFQITLYTLCKQD